MLSGRPEVQLFHTYLIKGCPEAVFNALSGLISTSSDAYCHSSEVPNIRNLTEYNASIKPSSSTKKIDYDKFVRNRRDFSTNIIHQIDTFE